MRKRFTALLLAVLMCLSMLPGAALAEEGNAPTLPDGCGQMWAPGQNGYTTELSQPVGSNPPLTATLVISLDGTSTDSNYTYTCSSGLGRVFWQDAGFLVWDTANAIPGKGWIYAEKDGNRYAIRATVTGGTQGPAVGIYMKAENGVPSEYIPMTERPGLNGMEYRYELSYSSTEGLTFYYYDTNYGTINGDNFAEVTSISDNFWMVRLKPGVSGNIVVNLSTGPQSGIPVFLTDTYTPPAAGIYMKAENGVPSEHIPMTERPGLNGMEYRHELSYSSKLGLTFYYFDANLNGIAVDGNVAEMTQIADHFWQITLKDGVFGDVVVSLATGPESGIPVFLTDTVPPAGVYTAIGGSGEPVLDSRVPEQVNQNGPSSYKLSYSSVEGLTFYYYNANAVGLAADSNDAYKVSISEVGSNLWEITLKDGVFGNQGIVLSVTYGNGFSNIYVVDLTDMAPPPQGPQVIPTEAPYSIPYEVKDQNKYAGASGEDTHLAAFTVDGEAYYMNVGGPFDTFPGSHGGMSPTLEQGEHMDVAYSIGFYVKVGNGEYQRVVESATLDKIEAAFGDTLRLEFLPYENAQADAFAPATFPALHSATVQNYMYDNNYCTSVMRLGLENRGWYMVRATSTVSGEEIAAESSFFWDVRNAAEQKTLDYREWSGENLMNIIPNLNYELANLNEQYTAVDIYLPAAELYGYIEVPASLGDVMVSIHGVMSGMDVTSIATKLYGGIISDNELVFMEKVWFLGANKANDTWGPGPNAGKANQAISGNGATNADLCVFEGFHIAANITGAGNKAVYRSILRNNGTAICFNSKTLQGGNNDLSNNRFERNDIALHFADLPETYALTWFKASYNSFIDNGIDVKNDIKRNIFIPGNFFGATNESGEVEKRECVYSPKAVGNARKQVLYYPQAEDMMFRSYIYDTSFYNHTGNQNIHQGPVISVDFAKTFPIPAEYLEGDFDIMQLDTFLAKISFLPQQQMFRMFRMTRAAVTSFDATVEVERSADGKTITVTTQPFPSGKTATISVPCDESWKQATVTAENGDELEATVADGYISFTVSGGGKYSIAETSPILYSVTYVYTGDVPANAPAVPDTAEYAAGAEVSVAAAPTLEGYTFSGWSKSDFTMPAEDVVIEGSWTADEPTSPEPPVDPPIIPSVPSDSSETVNNPDGSTTTNTSTSDGSKGSTTVKPDGSVEAEAKLSSAAIANAAAKGESVALPIQEVNAGTDSETAPVITVNTGSAQPVRVEIPVAEVSVSTVAVLVMPDGSEKIVKNCAPTEDGLELALPDGAVVKVVDNAAYFDDVHDAEHWGEEAIDFASARELMQGVGGDSFSPDTTTTRGMVFTVLARYADHDTTADAGEHWHVPGTDWAVDNGVSDGSDPDGIVTREQIITMLWRYAGSPAASGSYDGFVDADEVSDWASEAVRWAVSVGLIQGRGANDIAPKASATRAEFTQMLYKFCIG